MGILLPPGKFQEKHWHYSMFGSKFANLKIYQEKILGFLPKTGNRKPSFHRRPKTEDGLQAAASLKKKQLKQIITKNVVEKIR